MKRPSQIARDAWGEGAPEWVTVLAERCEKTSQQVVARRISYSAAVVSNVLRRKYQGDMGRVREAVQGAFMESSTECPVLGMIPSNECLSHQRQPLRTTNTLAVRIWRACRGGCAHSRIGRDEKC